MSVKAPTNIGDKRLKDTRQVIARHVRAARALRGWDQTELGRRVGLHRPVISDIEREVRSVRAEELEVIARATELPVVWFYGEETS